MLTDYVSSTSLSPQDAACARLYFFWRNLAYSHTRH